MDDSFLPGIENTLEIPLMVDSVIQAASELCRYHHHYHHHHHRKTHHRHHHHTLHHQCGVAATIVIVVFHDDLPSSSESPSSSLPSSLHHLVIITITICIIRKHHQSDCHSSRKGNIDDRVTRRRQQLSKTPMTDEGKGEMRGLLRRQRLKGLGFATALPLFFALSMIFRGGKRKEKMAIDVFNTTPR